MDQKERNEIRNLRISEAIARQHLIAAARVKNNDIRFSRIKSNALRSTILSALKRPGVAPNTRPRSKDGATTFHFKMSSVRNTSIELSRIAGKSTKGLAEAHARYIEREGAAEVADKKLKQSRSREPGREMQEYIERQGAAEEIGEELASFGNISPSYKERLDFWQQVEETERKPQQHKIKFFRDQSPKFWDLVANDPDAPTEFKKALKGELSEVLADESAIKNMILYAKKSGGFKGRRKAVSYEPGRGGRIQSRMILELPHEISPQERLNLAKEFTQVFEEKGLPYWAVIHAPDHHNDKRNNHLHIAFSERPAKRMLHPETGQPVWDFTIVETKILPNRLKRQHRPYRQPKDRDLNNKNWIPMQRRRFSKLMNEYLARAGVDRKTDHRKYKQMGIDATPIQRLSPTEYNFEKRGIDTPNGEATVKAQWERRQKELESEYDRSFLEPHLLQRWKKALNGTRRSDLGMRLQMAYFAWKENVGWKHALETNIAAADYVLKKIESKTLPPLREKTPYEKEAELFSKLWHETQIQPYAEAIIKTQIVQKKSLALLSYAEQKIASGDLTDHKWNEHMRKKHEQMAQLIQSLSMLNTPQKWDQFFASVAEDREKSSPNPRPNKAPTYRPKSPDEIMNVVKRLDDDIVTKTEPKPSIEKAPADQTPKTNQSEPSKPVPLVTKYVRVHVTEAEILEVNARLQREQKERAEKRENALKSQFTKTQSYPLDGSSPKAPTVDRLDNAVPKTKEQPTPEVANKQSKPEVAKTPQSPAASKAPPSPTNELKNTVIKVKSAPSPNIKADPSPSRQEQQVQKTFDTEREIAPKTSAIEKEPTLKKPVLAETPVSKPDISEAELRKRILMAQRNKKKKDKGRDR
jgi:MobA/MobL family